MKICIKCLSTQPLENFYKNKNRKDGLQDYCKECKKEYDKNSWIKNGEKWSKIYWKRQQKNLEIITNYKKERSCRKCFNNKWFILDFHHLNPDVKDFNISHGSGYSLKNIINEIEKCILLCRNCHSEFHYLERENNITIEEFLK